MSGTVGGVAFEERLCACCYGCQPDRYRYGSSRRCRACSVCLPTQCWSERWRDAGGRPDQSIRWSVGPALGGTIAGGSFRCGQPGQLLARPGVEGWFTAQRQKRSSEIGAVRWRRSLYENALVPDVDTFQLGIKGRTRTTIAMRLRDDDPSSARRLGTPHEPDGPAGRTSLGLRGRL